MADRTTAVVFVVTALSIGGFVNYRRNAALDVEPGTRIYADLTATDLNALIHDYEDDLRKLRRWAAENPTESALPQDGRPRDRAQKSSPPKSLRSSSQRWKTREQVIADHERMLEQLRHERSIREEGLDQTWYRIMRRMTRL